MATATKDRKGLKSVDDEEITEVVSAPEADLSNAADDALDVFKGNDVQQTAMVPSYKTKFVGMTYDSMDEVPQIDDEFTFIVKGTVVGLNKERRKNGEIVDIAKIDVTSVEVQ